MVAKFRMGLALAGLLTIGSALPLARAQDMNQDQSTPSADQSGAASQEQQGLQRQSQEDMEGADNGIPTPQADKEGGEPLSFGEKTSQAFSKLKPLLDAKKWDEALQIIDQAETQADPNSYDMAVLLDTKAKLLLEGKSDYAGAIKPWEQALRLYQTHSNYFKRQDVMNMLVGLAELYYQTGANLKNKAAQQQHFSKAIAYMRTWMKAKRHPSVEQVQFYASILYYKAVADPEHVNVYYLRQAGEMAKLGLQLTPQPRATFYQLLVAVEQQQNHLQEAADYLQLLLQLPGDSATKRNYWQELVSIYSNLAGNAEKNPRQQRTYYADAINTMEGAQRLGLMKTPRDNYNLVTMYYAVGQYGRAIELLNKGLHNGGIENTELNWKFLASFYQEEDKNFEAITVLKEAAERFPKDGGLDFTIAQIYEQLDRSADAYTYAKRAVETGNLGNNTFYGYQLEAWLAYSLKHYDEALKSIDAGEKLKARPSELAELGRMREAVLQAQKIEQNYEDTKRAAQDAEQRAREAAQKAHAM